MRPRMEQQDKKILCVGLVCLDIINVVEKYPEEDTDSRLAWAYAAGDFRGENADSTPANANVIN